MPDYQNGKIYKITSGDLTYIGSTTQPTLAKRLAQHVTDFKQWKDGKGKNVTSFQVLDLGNYEITLIELCPCGCKDELTARERFWIETIPCVNKYIPGRTHKEWFETHKEQIKEYLKKYKGEHREEIKKYHEDHREDANERSKKYTKDHKEQINEKKKAYYQANKEKICKAKKEKRAEKYLAIIK
jgi:gas vesicle protein